MSGEYDKNFYKMVEETALSSAEVVVPFVMEMVQPKTVVDIGCGTGTWLSVFRKYGAQKVRGVDGEWINDVEKKLPDQVFRTYNLNKEFDLGEKFDLALSLEVAEHLHESRAEGFVENLTRLAPVVVFSAAVPFQGGTKHINEQWSDYWAALFRKRDFNVIDCFRSQFFNDDRVKWWYSQNTFLYVREGCEQNVHFQTQDLPIGLPARMVHPKLFSSKAIAGAESERFDARRRKIIFIFRVLMERLVRKVKRLLGISISSEWCK